MKKTSLILLACLVLRATLGAAELNGVSAKALQSALQNGGKSRVLVEAVSNSERLKQFEFDDSLVALRRNRGGENQGYKQREPQYSGLLNRELSARDRSAVYGAMMDDLRADAAANASEIVSVASEAIRHPLRDVDAFKIAWTNAEALRESNPGLALTGVKKVDVARHYVTALNILARQPGGLKQVYQPGSIISIDLDSDYESESGKRFQKQRSDQERAIAEAKEHNEMAYFAPMILGRFRSLFNDGRAETVDQVLKGVGALEAVKGAVPR